MSIKAKKVSIVTYEGDRWKGDLLQRRLLSVLEENGVPAATVVNSMAGYTKAMGITTRSLVDGGGKLPVVVEFVAQEEQLHRLLPMIRPMVQSRMISVADVTIELGTVM
jgi:PII-like signaling protein